MDKFRSQSAARRMRTHPISYHMLLLVYLKQPFIPLCLWLPVICLKILPTPCEISLPVQMDAVRWPQSAAGTFWKDSNSLCLGQHVGLYQITAPQPDRSRQEATAAGAAWERCSPLPQKALRPTSLGLWGTQGKTTKYCTLQLQLSCHGYVSPGLRMVFAALESQEFLPNSLYLNGEKNKLSQNSLIWENSHR